MEKYKIPSADDGFFVFTVFNCLPDNIGLIEPYFHLLEAVI